MNIVKKEWIYEHVDLSPFKKELEEYEFNGIIDFAWGPNFYYDLEKCIVIDYEDTGRTNAVKILINDIVADIPKYFSNQQVQRIKFSRNYNLQDFFNEHQKAKCIVFYPYGNTIFHDGYNIRVFVDEEGYIPQNNHLKQ